MQKEELNEARINHPIKLEYYKEINEDELNIEDKTKFGITIIKTDYIENGLKVSEKEIKYVTNDEIEENRILKIFKENKVTPINSEEVIADLLKNKYKI